MEEKTKQRLTGVLVFVGALFIILPFLFHRSDSGISGQQLATQIPAAPATPTIAINAPVIQPATTSDSEQASAANSIGTPTPGMTNNNAITATSTGTAAQSPAPMDHPEMASPNPGAFENTPAVPPVTSTSSAVATTPPSQPVTSTSSPVAATPELTTTTSSPSVAPAPAPTTTPTPVTTPAPSTSLPAVSGTTTAPSATAASLVKKSVAHHATHTTHAKAKSSGAWTVQIGAFADKKNALALVSTLRKHHFEAYTRTIHGSTGKLTAVFVGPEINKNKVALVKKNLKARMKLNGVVRKYTL